MKFIQIMSSFFIVNKSQTLSLAKATYIQVSSIFSSFISGKHIIPKLLAKKSPKDLFIAIPLCCSLLENTL